MQPAHLVGVLPDTRGLEPAHAAMLVIATPAPIDVRQIADIARTLNPMIEIVLRNGSEAESQLLRKEAIGTVFYGEEELAKGMTNHVLQRFSPQVAPSKP